MTSLTKRQAYVLGRVRAFVRSHKRFPTMREVMGLIEVDSTNVVTDHFKALARKGYLHHEDHGPGHKGVWRLADGQQCPACGQEIAP